MTKAYRQHGPWQIAASQDVYADPWVRVQLDQCIRPDNAPGTYTVIHLKPGVCTVAIDDHDFLHLTEEFHYAVGRVTIEGVSGGREPGEDSLTTAQRELLEELGISAAEWTDLGTVDPLTANMTSPTQLFVARRLTWSEARPEGTELIRPVKMSLRDAVQQVLDGRISHGPTALLILKVAYLYYPLTTTLGAGQCEPPSALSPL